MSRNSKNKAVKHQNEIRNMIRSIFCPPFSDDDILSRTMGNSGADIILSPKAQEAIPFNIECKRHEDKTWSGTYKSSFEQAFALENGLLIRRKNRSGNHLFADRSLILDIHPSLMRNEKLTMYNDLRSFALSSKTCIGLFENYVHFNEKKFIEVLICLKRSYSQ